MAEGARSEPLRAGSMPLPTARPRRFRRWRVATLVGVNVLIAAHLLHGWWAGETFGRVVLADASATLASGVINPGFLLFALALLATALFGRFFCGWACHMGALQDLAAWLLRRVGVVPRPFHSRLLGHVPLALALYLFVWPSVERGLVVPLLARHWPTALPWFDPLPARAGWSVAWTSRDLWVGLPDVWVAIPFLLVCGVATVYFLGTRGLCRYGCPYGGLLKPVEQLAPWRIVVDAARCDQCARCTAACTMAIRVHEQVRDHGAVLDGDCLRTLDCIDACPQQALTLRPTTPTVVRDRVPALPPGLGWRGECWVAAVALLTLLLTRGLYARIPLLLAATLAVLAGFLAWQAVSLRDRRDWRWRRLVLRREGRLTASGRGAVALLVLCGALLLQTAAVRLALLQAARHDAQVTASWAQLAMAPTAVDSRQRAAAATALAWYRLAEPIGAGGIALARTPDVPLRMAWLELVRGNCGEAQAHLARERERWPQDEAVRAAASQAAALCALSPRSRR